MDDYLAVALFTHQNQNNPAMDTMLIQLTHQKAAGLLHELEELHIIKVLKETTGTNSKLSDKYKGIITREDGKKLNEHIKQMRSEWSNI